MLEEDEDGSPQEIPLLEVDVVAGRVVVAFLRRHERDPLPEIAKPVKSANMSDLVPKWDADLVDGIDQATLFKTILAANFLDVPSLLELGIVKVATMCKGKTPEEIKETFGMDFEVTPEEEREIRARNLWIFDAVVDESGEDRMRRRVFGESEE